MDTRSANSGKEGSRANLFFSAPLGLVVPILAVFCALALAYLFQVRNSWSKRNQLQLKLAELRKDLPRTQIVNMKMLQLSRDLVALGKRSLLAQGIVREFNIRVDASPAEKKK